MKAPVLRRRSRPALARPDELLALVAVVVCSICAEAFAQSSPHPMTPKESAEHVATLRVFFGHQSVGQSLVDSISGQVSAFDATENQTPPPNASFFHALVGENERPRSKVSDFARRLEALQARQPIDVAMMKLCYVDFDASTDVDGLFDAYAQTLRELRAKYPHTTFVHITTPLTTVQGGLRGWLKRHLGSGAWGERENARRHAYNERLRAAFKGEPLFDLAAIEATRPDGTSDTFELDGARVPRLRAELTDDGGHLNQAGRQEVSAALLRFLAQLPVKSQRQE